jgi:hypothetical protein
MVAIEFASILDLSVQLAICRNVAFHDYMACSVGLLSDCVMTVGAPNAEWTSNLVLYGSSIYALTPAVVGTPYGWYNGFKDFNALNLH